MIKSYDSSLQVKNNLSSAEMPDVYFIKVTSGCLNDCIFCGNKRGDVSVIEIDKNFLEKANDVVFIGNDPLVNPNILKSIAFIRSISKKIRIHIQTSLNFVEMSFLEKLLQHNIESFTISIFGPNSSLHDDIVGAKGSFESIIQRLELLVKNNVSIFANCLILPQNIDYLSEIQNLFFQYGIKGSFSIPYYKKLVLEKRIFFNFKNIDRIQSFSPVLGLPKCAYNKALPLEQLLQAGNISLVTYAYWKTVKMKKRLDICGSCNENNFCEGYIFLQDHFGLETIMKEYVKNQYAN